MNPRVFLMRFFFKLQKITHFDSSVCDFIFLKICRHVEFLMQAYDKNKRFFMYIVIMRPL